MNPQRTLFDCRQGVKFGFGMPHCQADKSKFEHIQRKAMKNRQEISGNLEALRMPSLLKSLKSL
jgi:hypothetical protein